MPRAVKTVALIVYCVAILFLLDFTYSSIWLSDEARPLRIKNLSYSHTLAASFDGFDIWGEARYPVITNNFGFKDVAKRDIPLKAEGRRILLIGDSFTEGIGSPFAETFAGMLYRAGQQRTPKVEYLNAGVAGYSPTLYYAKIKDLIDRGLQFDEVIVFADMSDIREEAVSYFCFDEIAEYRSRCSGSSSRQDLGGKERWLQKKFTVTDSLRVMLKYKLPMWSGKARHALTYSRLDGWDVPGAGVENEFGSLGIEGAIARARQHMQQLADLLKRRGIPLTVVVYPYAAQLAHDHHVSRQISLWRDFCASNCKTFINLFPAFFAAKEAHPSDWYERYFIYGDIHYNAAGNRVMFDALAKHLP